MESLLKWAILNGATANEDAPPRSAAETAAAQERMKNLDPAVIDAILGKPASVQMTECLDALEHPETPLNAREIALDDLEMLVENIDNASNLQPLQLWPRIAKLYKDPFPTVRSGALWVSGTAVQHNPNAQKAFPALSQVLAVLREDDDVTVRAKALYCVSAFVRANVNGLQQFVALDGLRTLVDLVKESNGVLREKALFLLRALVDEAMDEETPEELRPGRHLVDAVLELGVVKAAAEAVSQAGEDVGTLEKALALVAALAAATDGSKREVAECALLRDALGHAADAPQNDWAVDEIKEINKLIGQS
ncbi:hsp70 nucleotide exchange factor fes1 [Coemansia sp. Benny D115]|nr:hsp70 nucleotide exchange factor fes1 [Coemansia sp. Benny D115]